MQHRSSENHSNHHHQQHPQMEIVEEYQVFDVMPQRPVVHYAPPYPDVYGSSYGYRKPETHKVILEKNYESATEYAKDGNYRVYGAQNNAEADEFVKIKHGGHKVYEEDVDAEADDFIKYEHKKYQLGKSMSMDRF